MKTTPTDQILKLSSIELIVLDALGTGTFKSYRDTALDTGVSETTLRRLVARWDGTGIATIMDHGCPGFDQGELAVFVLRGCAELTHTPEESPTVRLSFDQEVWVPAVTGGTTGTSAFKQSGERDTSMGQFCTSPWRPLISPRAAVFQYKRAGALAYILALVVGPDTVELTGAEVYRRLSRVMPGIARRTCYYLLERLEREGLGHRINWWVAETSRHRNAAVYRITFGVQKPQGAFEGVVDWSDSLIDETGEIVVVEGTSVSWTEEASDPVVMARHKRHRHEREQRATAYDRWVEGHRPPQPEYRIGPRGFRHPVLPLAA